MRPFIVSTLDTGTLARSAGAVLGAFLMLVQAGCVTKNLDSPGAAGMATPFGRPMQTDRATQAGRPAVDEATAAGAGSVNAFCSQLMSDAALDPLRKKTAISGDATAEMLSDPSRITDAEKPVVALWVSKTQSCQLRLNNGYRQSAPPLIASHIESFHAAASGLRTPLYNGEMTWGQFNQARRKLALDFQRTGAEIQAALQRGDGPGAVAAQQAATAGFGSFVQTLRAGLAQPVRTSQ